MSYHQLSVECDQLKAKVADLERVVGLLVEALQVPDAVRELIKQEVLFCLNIELGADEGVLIWNDKINVALAEATKLKGPTP